MKGIADFFERYFPNKMIKGFFTKNIGWKLLALASSLILWAIAINADDPIANAPFNASVQIRNIEVLNQLGLVMLEEHSVRNTRVAGNVLVRTSNRDFIENVQPYIDLAGVDFTSALNRPSPVIVTVPILTQVTTLLSSGEYISNLNTTTIDLLVDRLITKNFDVEVDITEDLPSNLAVTQKILSFDTVTLEGPASVLNEVSRVVTLLDLSGTTNDTELTTRLIAFNRQDEDITNSLTIRPEEVEMYIAVSRLAQIPVRSPIVFGSLPPGYFLESVTISPQFIEIVGTVDAVSSISQITLPDVDISAMTNSQVRYVDISALLGNVSIRPNTSSVVAININLGYIEETTINVRVSTDSFEVIGLEEGITLQQEITLVISGTEAALNNLRPNEILGVVNVEDLYLGEHVVDVAITLPSGLSLAAPGTVIVTVENVEIYESQEDYYYEEDLGDDTVD